MKLPPKPAARAGDVSLRRYAQLFRKDILSAQPARLYKAWMAEFKTPFFRSFMINEPELVHRVLRAPNARFPKSTRVAEGLSPLLGASVFLTNGATWERQRRIIDPAFEGGRLKAVIPAMAAAGDALVARLREAAAKGPVEIEALASAAAADVIFRTLFSMPIEDAMAQRVFAAFRRYQRAQPMLNLAAFLPFPRWMPRPHRRQTRAAAAEIRTLITTLCARRMAEIEAGSAPDDLATKIMTTPDPETGETFSTEEMIDQVAIFFLAGHETSAAALSWALYLLATHPEWQGRVATEALRSPLATVRDVARQGCARDVYREALRLYPPVPMMVRAATAKESFRGRPVPRGAQIVVSPWHLHRHARLWDQPDAFDPGRWATENGQTCQREAFIPFSAGPRVCPGAGFAMIEGVLLLSKVVAAFTCAPVAGRAPEPVAHLTVRARDGIWLSLAPRDTKKSGPTHAPTAVTRCPMDAKLHVNAS